MDAKQSYSRRSIDPIETICEIGSCLDKLKGGRGSGASIEKRVDKYKMQ